MAAVIYDQETITLPNDNTAKSFTADKIDNTGSSRATLARIQIKAGPGKVYVRKDGSDPSAAVSSLELCENQREEIKGHDNVRNTRLSSLTSGGATIFVEYGYGA